MKLNEEIATIWRKILSFYKSLIIVKGCRNIMYTSRSCKRREILFQKSWLLFSTWREYFYSQPTHFSSQPKKSGYKQSFSPFTKPWWYVLFILIEPIKQFYNWAALFKNQVYLFHSHPPYFMALVPTSRILISISSDQGMSIHGWFLVTM